MKGFLHNIKTALISLLLTQILASCTGTRFLPKGEKLYTGAKVRIKSQEKVKHRNEIRRNASQAIRPQPNKSFLGMRPKVWLYGQGSQPGGNKKIREWMKKKGEAPVLLSSVHPSEISSFIDARLFNSGIFKASTEYEIVEKKKTAEVIYTSHIHKPFVLNTITYPAPENNLTSILHKAAEKSLLHAGDPYDLDKLKNERTRLDELLKNNGYFYFDADYLLFKADTSQTSKTVNLILTIKQGTPAKALVPYFINHITINADYSLHTRDSANTRKEEIDSVTFIRKEDRVRPRVILHSVYLKQGELYSRKNHNITLNRLMTLGNYKFVQVKFSDADSANNKLNVTILLTPLPQRTVRTEMDLISKSNDFIGPRSTLSYHNRNAFHGAELFTLNVAGSFETQISGQYRNLYSWSINPLTELYIPGFVTPFNLKKTSSTYVPKTRISAGYNYLRRVRYFDMQALQLIFGYKWKEDAKKEHELNPVNINFTSIKNRSPEFQALLQANPFLRKSYEEQFIIGASYSFTYNEQVQSAKKEQFYLNLLTETSGNTASLVNIITGYKITADHPAMIGGAVYSQYARIQADGRAYTNFRNKTRLALRVIAGVGQPYQNSSILPNIKQFFSGGPNSIRAFHINSVGPGTYRQITEDQNGFLQLGGDIKIESSVEYRFNIFRYFKGALFTDAGNVWLMKANPQIDAKPFAFNRFYKELAVGAGIGLRIDVSFFVLRFDVAMPLRKPWLQEGSRWVLTDISFGNPSWRGENLILNIAIGYPF